MKLIRPLKIASFAIILLLSTIILHISCKKLDRYSHELSPESVEAKFFAAKPGLPLPVLKVMDALKKQNAISGFIPSLAQRDGYAVWERSQVKHLNKIPTFNRNGENDDVIEVFTPIVQQDSNFVNGFFFSKIVGDSVELHLYRGNDYKQYPYGKTDSLVVTAELIASKLMVLDHEVFGARRYKVTDTRLYGGKNPYGARDTSVLFSHVETDPSTSNKMIVTCWYIFSGYCTCSELPCKDWWMPCPRSECSSLMCLVTHTETGGTAGWPPDPPISTGGGGSGTPPSAPNCTATTNCGQLRSLIVQGKEPCGGCGPGPVIVVPIEEPPTVYEIIYDPSFQNSRLLCNLEDLEANNNFFSSLLGTFDGINGNSLRFNIIPQQNFPFADMWAVTRGWGQFRYAITSSSELEAKSNIYQKLTLIHELIHARLYYSLERAGLISYDQDGNPFLDDGIASTPSIGLMGLPEAERLRALIDEYNTSCAIGPYFPNNWVHHLMGTANFNLETFRVNIQNLLHDNGNWANESTQFQSHLSSVLGANWQVRASEYLSWFGLRETAGFDLFLQNENISETQFEEIIDYIRENGNETCQ